MSDTISTMVYGLCKELIETNQITPITFDFPTFSINKASFNNQLLLTTQEIVDFYILAGYFEKDILGTQQTNKFLSEISQTTVSLSKKTLNELVINQLSSKLAELEFISFYDAPHLNSVSSFTGEKAKFAATLLMIKLELPSVYNDVSCLLKAHHNQSLVKDIVQMEKEEHFDVINEIRKINNNFAKEHFPKIFAFLETNDKIDLNTLKF